MDKIPSIEVIGKSAQKEGDVSVDVAQKAKDLGKALGVLTQGQINIFTGAGTGYPERVATEAKANGAHTFGFSPATDFESAEILAQANPGFLGKSELNKFSGIVFLTLPPDDETEASAKLNIKNRGKVEEETQKARNKFRSEQMNDVIAEQSGCLLVVGGGSGTERELVDALKKNLPVGILLGTGGLTEGLEDPQKFSGFIGSLSEITGKDVKDLIYYSADPKELAQQAINKINKEKNEN